MFVNGLQVGSTYSDSNNYAVGANRPIIGSQGYSSDFDTRRHRGFISNLRVIKGTALYTSDFIPPTRELKNIPGTVLLCCKDSNDPTAEETGKTITGYGDLQTADGVELVSNGTFDTDTTGWSVNPNGTFVSSGGRGVLTNTQD